jgi:hypothetical protein
MEMDLHLAPLVPSAILLNTYQNLAPTKFGILIRSNRVLVLLEHSAQTQSPQYVYNVAPAFISLHMVQAIAYPVLLENFQVPLLESIAFNKFYSVYLF